MKRYAIVVEKAQSNYSAYVPDLPGCVATGESVEKTKRLLREAIALHLAGLREDGLPVPEPSSVVSYVQVPDIDEDFRRKRRAGNSRHGKQTQAADR